MNLEDRYYQTDAINSVFRYFEEKNGNPLIAMPTGTGKSIVIGKLIKLIYQYWPNQRVMVLTHVRELIRQNVGKMYDVWPTAPVGIYSAGLDQRDFLHPIIFGGVASVVRCIEAFGHRDLLIIDEAHLLSPNDDTMYQKIISHLRALNPKLKVIGLTATWYRLGQGLLTDGGLFTDICYNICDVAGFARLISEGYLVAPIPKVTATALDVSQVGVQKGEFVQSQLQQAVDKRDINFAVLSEICDKGRDRHSWLIFCSGIEHSEHIAEMLDQQFGVPAACVHSKMSLEQRDEAINGFKSGRYRALTNNQIFTTGQDHPPIDMIGMLRPTMSPGLWVQMIGRGTRPNPDTGKRDCLVLDFARNTPRLGPIDDPAIPRPKGPGTGDVPVKLCDACGAYNHTRVRFCVACGHEFTFEQKLVRQAGTAQLLSSGSPVVEKYRVDRVMYNRHIAKKSGIVNIKISYFCGLRMFNEFISFDHTASYAKHRAHEWWRQRHSGDIPPSTDFALAQLNQCRTPKHVRVWVNKIPYPEVLGTEF